MRRREFLLVAGGAATSWPLLARAQQPAKLPTIGYLGPDTPSIDTYRLPPFVQRLRELGWIEGRTIKIEYQWAQGSRELADKIAAEFVRRKVDIIVTSATPPTTAAKQATSVIPIVFAAVGDPVATGLVVSLARPGGNATGLSLQQTDAACKRLELLREAIPGIRRLAILANSGNLSVLLDMREAQAMAQTAGFEAVSSEIRDPEDIAPAINAFRSRVEALYVSNDPLVATNRVRISAAAVEVRLPTMFGVREYVEVGGLMSFGPSFPDLYRRTADYVDKILRGAKPSDLPVEQPTKFELVINLKTAKALGIIVPPTLLTRADEVIE
jgi:putative tryptophan/tyrosine transport system substrate-binding protein